MDDKRLDDLLQGLKKNYDRLPEYTDTKDIMQKIPEKRKRKKRFHIIPLVAIIAGLALFFILAMPMMEEYQQANFSKNYLQDYADKKKEEFRKELGLSSVDDFYETEQVANIIDYYQAPMSLEEIEEAKKDIDVLYTTPSQLMNEINSSDEEDLTEIWNQLFMIMSRNVSLNDYFSDLKIKYSLDSAEQAELLEMQYNYEGPTEIAEFVQMIHNQGFYIEKRHYQYQSPVEVRINYAYIEQQITNFENHEGIQVLLNFLSEKMDLQNPGINNMYNTPWDEFDTLLLELENIYRSYQEDWKSLFSAVFVLYPVSYYLNDYLSAGVSSNGSWSEEDIEILQKELINFEIEHQNSIYWPIIASILEEYEKNEWQINRTNILEELYYVFSDEAQKLEFDYLKRVDSYTISYGASNKYNLYKGNKDLNDIKYNPIDMLSIYLHSFSADEKLYRELYVGEEEQQFINWRDKIEIPSILIGNTIDQSTIEYTFINLMYEPVVKVRMINDGDSWKVTKQELMN